MFLNYSFLKNEVSHFRLPGFTAGASVYNNHHSFAYNGEITTKCEKVSPQIDDGWIDKYEKCMNICVYTEGRSQHDCAKCCDLIQRIYLSS